MIFTLDLSHPSASPLRLTYNTLDDSAIGGEDFVHASGQIIFAPGQQTKTLRIDLINDGLFEGDEAFALNVAFADGPENAKQASGTIQDDEAPRNYWSIQNQHPKARAARPYSCD